VEGGLAVAQAGLDVAFMAMDPIGALLARGRFGFPDGLDDLTGDPGAVGAHAATWGNMGEHRPGYPGRR